tara:strand:- start:193 stop:1059 length:867 start_codon:yes stop_codon:yes gene_type:complete
MKNCSLVVSSGGARGFAAIGIIEELEKKGYKIKSVAGCSIGSLITGMYAAGKLEDFKRWSLSLTKKDILMLMDINVGLQGILRGEKVFEEIKKNFDDVDIEKLDIPYAAVAVDLLSGQEIVFKKGSLFSAIRASCSVPSLMKPFKKDDKVLVDGGIKNPLPFSIVSKNKKDILIGVDLNCFKKNKVNKESYFGEYQKHIDNLNSYMPVFFKKMIRTKDKEVGSYIDISARSFKIMQDELSSNSIKKHKPDILFEISRDSCNMLNFFKAKELIDFGRLVAQKKINNLDK